MANQKAGRAAEHCPHTSRPDASSFTALAVGNPDRDKALDVWSISQDKSLENILDDLAK